MFPQSKIMLTPPVAPEGMTSCLGFRRIYQSWATPLSNMVRKYLGMRCRPKAEIIYEINVLIDGNFFNYCNGCSRAKRSDKTHNSAWVHLQDRSSGNMWHHLRKTPIQTDPTKYCRSSKNKILLQIQLYLQ